MSETLIVIPARGGSVGIPRKALRPLGGIAPLARTIATAKRLDARIVVSTSDAEIADLARSLSVQVIDEPLAINPHGKAALDGAVHYAVEHAGGDPSIVVTMQCTSPFLEVATVAQCIGLAASDCYDAALTVRDDRHVAWDASLDQMQLATPWAVRQSLPARWVMTGGCIATKRRFVTAERRFGGRIHGVEVKDAEAIDLDNPADWAVAEWHTGAPSLRETVLARVLGEKPQWQGLVLMLSCWDESGEELAYRRTVVAGRSLSLRGAHTREEAELALAQRTDGEHDLTIVTSAYHQLRAFLTFLKVLQERGLDRTVRLRNAPAASRMDKLAQELDKIAAYQAKGHVASFEDGLRYLQWRDSQ